MCPAFESRFSGFVTAGEEKTEQRDAFLHSFICHSIDVGCPGFESRFSEFVTVGAETTEQRNAFLHSFICHSIDVCVLGLNLGPRALKHWERKPLN